MKCACCGRKKKLLESFEKIDTDINICVDCSKLLYKYQDAVRENDQETEEELLNQIGRKKRSKEFDIWLENFQKRLGVQKKKKQEQKTDGKVEAQNDKKA